MPKKNNTDWKTAEKLAAILEKFITPNSSVEHNKFLPVIGKPNRQPRQCDVVITIGSGARKSITIVEVQKRNSKPSISEFQAWITKMREVGAQQLICVSKMGYPSSIIDEVKNTHGNKTVTLMSLEEFDYLSNPAKINILPFQILMDRTFAVASFGKIGLENQQGGIKIDFNSKVSIFSITRDAPKINVNELALRFIESVAEDPDFVRNEMTNERTTMEIDINASHDIYLHHNGKSHKILRWSFKIVLTAKKRIHRINVKQYTYSQKIINGTIAWIASTQLLVNGIERQVDLVFKTDGGKFTMASVIRE